MGQDDIDWSEVMELFHKLWGNARVGTYEKPLWNQMRVLLEEMRRSSPPPPADRVPSTKPMKDLS